LFRLIVIALQNMGVISAAPCTFIFRTPKDFDVQTLCGKGPQSVILGMMAGRT
jgi:hypothetical protein